MAGAQRDDRTPLGIVDAYGRHIISSRDYLPSMLTQGSTI
jgi:hypothetical protein